MCRAGSSKLSRLVLRVGSFIAAVNQVTPAGAVVGGGADAPCNASVSGGNPALAGGGKKGKIGSRKGAESLRGG